MLPATKQLDLVLGIDCHVVVHPPPVPPTPTPTPFTGFLFDPLESFTASVLINGQCRATAGTKAIAMPPHIPLGGTFLKPPTNDGELFMGSSSVLVDGEPQGFSNLPVLTCQDVGMPSPPRAGKSGSVGMYLPTSVVLSIPSPAPVLIGGAPTISMQGMAMKAIGPLAKKLRGAFLKSARGARADRLMRRASCYLNDLADRVFDKLRLSKTGALRNKVSRHICTATGHPVDVATGKVFTDFVDLTLPGPLPFALERVWYSSSDYEGPLGRGWHASFDMALAADERVVGVRLGDGRAVLFPALKVGASYFDSGERMTLERQAEGYVLHAGELQYDFASSGALTRIRNRDGARVCFLHSDGRLRQIVDSGGRTWELRYAGARVVALEGPHPTDETRVVYQRWAYERECLVEASDVLGHGQRFAYADGLLVRETLKSGLSFHFTYDGEGRCVRTWGDGGLYDHKLTYDPLFKRTTVVNSLGHKTVYEHDGAMVHRTVDALGNETRTEYDEGYRVLVSIDELGQRTMHKYDARGNLTLTIAPDGATTVVEHASDLPVRAVDPNGGEWSWEYDARGREVLRRDPLGHEVRREYGERGLSAVIEAGRTRFEYDARGNLICVVEPNGACTRFEHDHLGRVIAVEDARGGSQTQTLDLRGRAVAVCEPDGNVRTLAYDAEDNLVHAKDTNSEVRFRYCGMNRLAARLEAGTRVEFQYDSEEQLVALINEHGLAYRFEHGPTGHVEVERGFDGLTRRYHRDRAGRVVRVDRPAERWTRYEHDEAGRVIAVEHHDGSKESYVYRADGALISASNDDTSVDFERDPLGRIVRETQAWAWDEIHGRGWVESKYDARGRVRMRSSYGIDQHIERDAMGDVRAVTEARSGFHAAFERDLLGDELRRTVGKVQSRWTRDRMGRPTTHVIESDQRTLRAVGYQWTPNDRLAALIDSTRGPTRYRHDARGHLALAHYPDGKTDVRMPDAVGNLYRSETRDDRKYGPAGELLWMRDERGDTHCSYDPEGNLLSKREPTGATWHYAWNGAGLLRAVTRPDGSQVTFHYDPLARRVAKTYRGQTTHWLWDGNVPLHEWVEGTLQPLADAGGIPWATADASTREREAELEAHLQSERGTKKQPITWLFEPGSLAPLVFLHSAQAQPIFCDHLGAPVVLVEDAARLFSTKVDAYGRAVDAPVRWNCPFRWPGQYEDSETGLHYNRFRYYDPADGGYLSQDPLRLAGGPRLHAYVADPLAWTDPFGLSEKCARERKLPRYDGPKPTYHVNEAHVLGSRHFNKHKTPLPTDAAEVFGKAVPDDPLRPRNWFGLNRDGLIYRFSNANDNTAHFSGMEGAGDGVRNATRYALARLGRGR